ncbi:MAG: hypothetical protein M1833_002593 [Piccolia ochrophora]|nr:MAG: hypothetical protein M1833_002593 [Piccolia ochrophora]
MAYNSKYNPDALPAHAEPEQAAQLLSGHQSPTHGGGRPHAGSQSASYHGSGNSRPHGSSLSSSSYQGRPSYSKPQPPIPSPPERMQSPAGPSHGYHQSPPPSNYGFQQPPPQAHSRPPIMQRPPPTPAPPAGADSGDLYPLFRAVDKSGSGQLSENELRAALVNGDYTTFDTHTVRMMIRMFDTDRSGTIGFDEFRGLWGYLTSWRSLFDRFDADRSGNISLDEYSNALTSFGYRLTPSFVQVLFRSYDRRGTNAISFDLFVQSCISLKRMTDVFKKYDEDRDGYITLSL